MKDEGAIDWGEGFPTSIGQGEQFQGKGGERDILCFMERKGGQGKCGKEINSYVGKCVVHEKKKYVQPRAWKEVVCSKYLKWSS
jgi:hypothetical protein